MTRHTRETEPGRTYAQAVAAGPLHAEISALGVTHVLIVPDTHQKSLLSSIGGDPKLTTLTFSTEDEAICVNAGLWIGGAEPLVIIQNVGLFAAMNALRGVAMDMRVPTCMLVGQYGRDVAQPVESDGASAVRLIEPVLQTMQVPFYRLDDSNDLPVLRTAFEQSRSERGPAVVLVGAPTA
jgi:sulfopyruvate decarboxylase TPP-binding subunit